MSDEQWAKLSALLVKAVRALEDPDMPGAERCRVAEEIRAAVDEEADK